MRPISRFSLLKAFAMLVLCVVCCAVSSAQGPNKVNPFTGIAWPANCSASGVVAYNLLTNTCFPAGSSTTPILYTGTWSNTRTYLKNANEVDAVFYGGDQWITIVNNNLNHQPDTSPTQWALLLTSDVTALTMQQALAGQSGCTTAGYAWNPATNTCLPPSGGGGSGCTPVASPANSVQMNTNTGGCANFPMDYGRSETGIATLNAPLSVDNTNPPDSAFWHYTGRQQQYWGSQEIWFQDQIPGAVEPYISSFAYGPSLYQQWYVGWDKGAPYPFFPSTASESPWFGANVEGLIGSVYSAGIFSAYNMNLIAEFPGDMNLSNRFVFGHNSCIAAADQCWSFDQDKIFETSDMISTITSLANSGTQLNLNTSDNGNTGGSQAAASTYDTLIDYTSGAAITLSNISIHNDPGLAGNYALAQTSTSHAASNQGHLLTSIVVPTNLANTTRILSSASATFSVAIATPPTANSSVCTVLGSSSHYDDFIPTSVSGSAGVYTMTYPTMYHSHYGGQVAAITGNVQGTGYSAGQTLILNTATGTAIVHIDTVGGSGNITTASIYQSGNDYSVATNVPTRGSNPDPATGTGATFNITAVTGASVNCDGLVGYAYGHPSTDGRTNQNYVEKVLASPDSTHVWLAHQVGEGYEGQTVGAETGVLYKAAEVVGVMNVTTGQPDGTQLNVMAHPTFTVGDTTHTTNAISAGYEQWYVNLETKNPWAPRNPIVLNWYYNGGVFTNTSGALTLNNTQVCGLFNGCGGTARPPYMMMSNGYISTAITGQYVPLGDLVSNPDANGVPAGWMFGYPSYFDNSTSTGIAGLFFLPGAQMKVITTNPGALWDISSNAGQLKAYAWTMPGNSQTLYTGTCNQHPFQTWCFGTTQLDVNAGAEASLAAHALTIVGYSGGSAQFGLNFTNALSDLETGSPFTSCSILPGANSLNITSATNNCVFTLNGAAFGSAFSALTNGTNTTAAMVVGSGASLGWNGSIATFKNGSHTGVEIGSGTQIDLGSDAYLEASAATGAPTAGLFLSRFNSTGYAGVDLVTGASSSVGWSMQMQPSSTGWFLFDRAASGGAGANAIAVTQGTDAVTLRGGLSVAGGANTAYICTGGTLDGALVIGAAKCVGGSGAATQFQLQ
jgi:hypothetical protein